MYPGLEFLCGVCFSHGPLPRAWYICKAVELINLGPLHSIFWWTSFPVADDADDADNADDVDDVDDADDVDNADDVDDVDDVDNADDVDNVDDCGDF